MSGASTFLLFLRVGFSLAVVLAMIWGVARFAKRRGRLPSRGADAHLDVVARRQLGRRGSLVVVETAGRSLLVGITDQAISLVADLTAIDPAPAVAPSTLGHLTVTDQAEPEVIVADLRGAERVVRAEATAVADRHERRESLMDALRDLTVRRT